MAASSPAPLDLYNHPELWRWAGGMDGVPEWLDPAETFGERAGRAAWQSRGNEWFALLGAPLPGLAIALGVAVVGRAPSTSWYTHRCWNCDLREQCHRGYGSRHSCRRG